jgi:hypothetical protein
MSKKSDERRLAMDRILATQHEVVVQAQTPALRPKVIDRREKMERALEEAESVAKNPEILNGPSQLEVRKPWAAEEVAEHVPLRTSTPLEKRLLEALDPHLTSDPGELRVLAYRLGVPKYLPASTMTVEHEAWQRLMAMKNRTSLPISVLTTYILSVLVPKPTGAFTEQWTPHYEDLAEWLTPVLSLPKATATRWQRPEWLYEPENPPTGIKHPVRYIEHPYLALRLAEMEAQTGLRSQFLSLAVRRFFPPSTVGYKPKQRRS